MYGEHLTDAEIEAVIEGSSPHVRGALRVGGAGGHGRGIIPAYTGSTRSSTRSTECRGDHPRMYGEHLINDTGVMGDSGSSPHVRGTPTICLTVRNAPRDHPRMYGEH